MGKKNWEKIAREQYENLDIEEKESFFELRAKIYGE